MKLLGFLVMLLGFGMAYLHRAEGTLGMTALLVGIAGVYLFSVGLKREIVRAVHHRHKSLHM